MGTEPLPLWLIQHSHAPDHTDGKAPYSLVAIVDVQDNDIPSTPQASPHGVVFVKANGTSWAMIQWNDPGTPASSTALHELDVASQTRGDYFVDLRTNLKALHEVQDGSSTRQARYSYEREAFG